MTKPRRDRADLSRGDSVTFGDFAAFDIGANEAEDLGVALGLPSRLFLPSPFAARGADDMRLTATKRCVYGYSRHQR